MRLKEAIVESIKGYYAGKPFTAMEEESGEPIKYTFDYMDSLKELKEDKKNGSSKKKNV